MKKRSNLGRKFSGTSATLTKKPSALKVDPTRTVTLRKAAVSAVRRKFALLRGKITKLVLIEDALGLKERRPLKLNVENCNPGQLREAGGRCGPGIGVEILRSEMPQIRGDDLQEFLKFVDSRQVRVIPKTVRADDLSPTQREFRQERVDAIPEEKLRDPILVSRDGYVLDGTHRWVKHWQKDKKSPVPVLSVDLDLHDGLALMRQFPKVKFVENATTTNRWQFATSQEKILEFQKWLRQQFASTLLGKSDEELWRDFAERGFAKGAGRAFDDTIRTRRWEPGRGDFYSDSKKEFLRTSFGRPETVEKLQLLASRSFTDLRNVTEDMSTRMSRTLMDGLASGSNPREMVDDLMKDLDVGEARAETIARTEIIRAHAEGQLDSLEKMGVEEVGVAVEWSTAGDSRVCPRCQPLEGVVLTVEEAHGLIPNHPNCRCSFIPANVGEDDAKQKRSKEEIEAAFAEADVDPPEIDPVRPKSQVSNSELEDEEYWFHRDQQEDSIEARGTQDVSHDLREFSRLVRSN